MSIFEQIIIPFIDDTIQLSDLTKEAGFIDSFTYDIDHPTDKYVFYLVYDDRVRTPESIERARRFDKSKRVRYKYVKIVDNVPWYVYQFWVGPEAKTMYKDSLHLTYEQKLHIVQWWGSDKVISRRVLMEPSFVFDCTRSMPPEDYRQPPYSPFDDEEESQVGLSVKK
jgi:hypothetical protein